MAEPSPPSPAVSLLERLVIWALVLFWSTVAAIRLVVEWFRNRETFFEHKEHLKPKVLDGWTHENAQLSEVKLHYVEAGDMDHPLMLMLHGFPEFWYSWRHQIRYFQTSYHVVAVDMRGYNESDKPEGVEHYHSSVIAKDIKELITVLNHDRAILVGHDWGAAIAWRVAIEYPDLVDKLIILNGPHPIAFSELMRSNLAQFLKSWYMFMFQMPLLPEFIWKCNDFASLKKNFRSERYGLKNKQNFTDEDEEAWLYVFSKSNAFTGPLNYYRAILSKQDSRHISSSPIKPKTLIIWGNCDAFLEKSCAEMSTKYCEMAQVKYIEGASHWVQQDSPDAVNSYMEKFLNEITLH